MASFFKEFLIEEARKPNTGPARELWLAAFGKHPAWKDFIEPIGLDTDTLKLAYRLLFEEGLGGKGSPITSGAWESLAPDELVPRFEHVFVWVRGDHFLIGRMWASSDCAHPPRTLYPLVACVHGTGLSLPWALRNLLPKLDGLPALCRIRDATEVAATVNEVWSSEAFRDELRTQVQGSVTRLRQELRSALAEAPSELPTHLLTPRERERFLAAPELGPDHEGLWRVLYQVENRFSAYRDLRSVAKGDNLGLPPQQVRVPTCAESLAEGVLRWCGFLRVLLPPDLPMIFTAPSGADWLDITLGPPTPDQFFCLRATPRAMPLASSVPFAMTPEFRQQNAEVVQAFQKGERLAAPKPGTAFVKRLSSLGTRNQPPPAPKPTASPPPPPPPPRAAPPQSPLKTSPPQKAQQSRPRPPLPAWVWKAGAAVAALMLVAAFLVLQPPRASSQGMQVAAGKPTAIQLTGSGRPWGTLSYTVVEPPRLGSLTGTAPQLVYTANPDARGTDRFTYKVSEGGKESPPATVTLNFPVPVVAQPTISPNGGSYTDSVLVTLACTNTTAAIHYTLDGREPTTNSPRYNKPFPLTNSSTVTVRAWAADHQPSAQTSARFEVNPTPVVAQPTITPNGGSYKDSVLVTLACTNTTPVIYYTLDGREPTTNSTRYSQPFTLTQSSTVTVKAWLPDHRPSPAASAQFQVSPTPVLAQPAITPNGGSYTDSVLVTLACTNTSATIHYTLDGREPTTNSTRYSQPFPLMGTNTVTARAWAPNHKPSLPISARFEVSPMPVVVQPTITPNGGSYKDSVLVTLACTNTRAAIHYTLDGREPTTNSTGYSQPFTLTQSGTVTVKAWLPDHRPSPAASARFELTTTPLTALGQTVEVKVGEPQRITLLGTGGSGKDLSFTVVEKPRQGSLTGTGAQRVYTPNPQAAGTDNFTFKVSDGRVESTPATIGLTIHREASKQTAALSGAQGSTPTIESLDREFQILLVQFRVLRARDPDVTYPEARGAEPITGQLTIEARDRYLARVSYLKGEYERLGSLNQKNRDKLLKQLRDKVTYW